VLYQDEMCVRCLDSFLSGDDSNLVFITTNGVDTFTLSGEIPQLDKQKRKGLVLYKAKVIFNRLFNVSDRHRNYFSKHEDDDCFC